MFELIMSIREIQRTNLWIAVMEPRYCGLTRIMGEATVELGNIWNHPHHQVVRKWIQLTLPRIPGAGAVGFLQMDIAIIFREELQVMSVSVEDRFEDNLLLPSGLEQQPANFMITIFGAFGLSNGILARDRRFEKPPSSYVKVSFCGLSAKTAVQPRNNHPIYSEQINIVEMFPNLSEVISFEVCSADGYLNKVLAGTYLKLSHISYDGDNGFVPTFGPSLLHMYGTSESGTFGTSDEGPYYLGALLMSLKTIVPYYQQRIRSTNVEPATALQNRERFWSVEDFCIFCPIFEVSMLDCRCSGKICGIAITVGELPCVVQGDEETHKLHYTGALNVHHTHSDYGYLNFEDGFPVLQLATRLPDFRLRMYRNNMVHGIIIDLENAITVVERRLNNSEFTPRDLMEELNSVYDDVAGKMLKFLDIVHYAHTSDHTEDNLHKYSTELDSKHLALQREEMVASREPIQLQLSFDQNSPFRIHVRSNDNLRFDLIATALQLDRCVKKLRELAYRAFSFIPAVAAVARLAYSSVGGIEKVYQQITKRPKSSWTRNLSRSSNSTGDTKKKVKLMLSEMRSVVEYLRDLLFKAPMGWPDLVIWLLSSGSRVAYCKMTLADIIYSVIPEQNGKSCGQIQSLLIKPLKCPKHTNSIATNCVCVVGRVELLFWMGLNRQSQAFYSSLPKGYKLKYKGRDMIGDMYLKPPKIVVECRVFVYKAKISNSAIGTNEANSFVRITALNNVRETKVKSKTLNPVWNQVLKVQKQIAATKDRLVASPPAVLVEVHDNAAADRNELIGRLQLQPMFTEKQDYDYAPKLQWFDMHRGVEYTGQLLISLQIIHLHETEMKNIVYSFEGAHLPESNRAKNSARLESDEVEPLPKSLIPKSKTYKMDVYWWGLRDVPASRKPCVVLEMDDLTVKSNAVSYKKPNCNFPNGRCSHTLQASLNEMYCTPLKIKLYDSSTFGRSLFLGTHVVKNPTKYIVNWLPKVERETSLKTASITSSHFLQVNQVQYVVKQPSLSLSESLNRTGISEMNKKSIWRTMFCFKEPGEEESVLLPMFSNYNRQMKMACNSKEVVAQRDWWTRYYSSLQSDSDDDAFCIDKITIYDSELEKQPEFNKFKDWCVTLKLYSGTKTGIPDRDNELHCGYLKAAIAMYRWPPPLDTVAVSQTGVDLYKGYFNDYPTNESSKFLVRVYVIKGVNLKTKSFTSRLDPYVAISCGNKHLGDRKNYVNNTLNPIFGKMYEFRCTLPDDYLLTVSLYDYDATPPDQLVGTTTIDLENRIYSKHRATVGLPFKYNLSGANKWRDCNKPSIILEQLCTKNHLQTPKFPDPRTVVVNGVEYKANKEDKYSFKSPSDLKENICLHLLHNWHTLPICGYHLVPEHVESRSLYNNDKPGLEQGKLQMWIDIFPLNSGIYIPPAVNIAPRKLEEYELRVIVWNVEGIKFDENGKKVTDIFIRAWMDTIEEAQYTDVQFNVTSGEASFNWRMIFHFLYHQSEKKLLKKEKGPFIEMEERIPPIFVLQVIDSDSSTMDEYLGSLSFNLNHMSRGIKHRQRCTYEELEKAKKINLFTTMSIRAWWPLVYTKKNTGQEVATGIIDLELTLLPKEKALLMPVGLGREAPAPLPQPKPKRSEASFSKNMTWRCDLFMKMIVLVIFIGFIISLCYFTKTSIARDVPTLERCKLRVRRIL